MNDMSDEMELKRTGELSISSIKAALLPEIQKMIEKSNQLNLKSNEKVLDFLEKYDTKQKYTIADIAKMTNKHHRTVRYWITIGLLQATKVGSKWTITQEDYDKFLEKGESNIKEEVE